MHQHPSYTRIDDHNNVQSNASGLSPTSMFLPHSTFDYTKVLEVFESWFRRSSKAQRLAGGDGRGDIESHLRAMIPLLYR